jgi:c-di-GMP-binding flagellar brake protein YcgR
MASGTASKGTGDCTMRTAEATAIELKDRQARAMLSPRLTSGVRIEWSSPPCASPLAAEVDGFSDLGLDLSLDDQAHEAIAVGDQCRVTIDIDGQHAWFQSVVLSTGEGEAGALIRIAVPESVTIEQRRRFWRAPVRRSSTVHLTPVGQSTLEAALLNISIDGLACRLARRDARHLDIATTVGLTFELDDNAQIAIDGTVRAVTPASEPENTIVRLQFSAESIPDATRERIKRATQVRRQP